VFVCVLCRCGAVDCGVSTWSDWSSCSVKCGGGIQTQTRTVTQQAANGGAACPTTLSQTQACNTQGCPVDCVVSAWSAFSACSTSCGGGNQTATRAVVTPAAYGGAACPSLSMTQSCNLQPCPVDCVVSSWSNWTDCSTRCGGGTQSQSRTVVTAAANGGAACPTLSQSQACNTQGCPGTALFM
jgi:Spondin-like TSP1 domain